MERLPGDLLLVILRKLAALDPLSLFRSTCTFAPLHRAAGANPDVWKKAFFHNVPEKVPGHNLQFEQYQEEQVAKMDAEVVALGGYKRLLIARYSADWTKCAEQSQDLRNPSVEPECAACCFRARLSSGGVILTLVRLQGRIWMWGIHGKKSASTSSPFLYRDVLLGSNFLQHLYPVDSHELVERMRQHATSGGFISSQKTPAGPLSVEFFTFPSRETRENAFKDPRSGASWVSLLPYEAWVDCASRTWYSLRGLLPSAQHKENIPCDLITYLTYRTYDKGPNWRVSWQRTGRICINLLGLYLHLSPQLEDTADNLQSIGSAVESRC